MAIIGGAVPLTVGECPMRDGECVAFLQWCLPRMGLDWSGYRKVRGTVCKRLGRRLGELGLADLAAYRARLADDPAEWARLGAMCRIPISRFWRDRGVFDWLAATGLPRLAGSADARPDRILRVWSIGCASGEEPYSVAIAFAMRAAADYPRVRLDILATDADATMIARAKAGRYRAGSLRDLPPDWRARALEPDGDLFAVRPDVRRDICFRREDVRRAVADGPFDLILCRNVAFTYFDAATRRAVFADLSARLAPHGLIVIGAHERLPEDGAAFERVDALPVFRHAPRPA